MFAVSNWKLDCVALGLYDVSQAHNSLHIHQVRPAWVRNSTHLSCLLSWTLSQQYGRIQSFVLPYKMGLICVGWLTHYKLHFLKQRFINRFHCKDNLYILKFHKRVCFDLFFQNCKSCSYLKTLLKTWFCFLKYV